MRIIMLNVNKRLPAVLLVIALLSPAAFSQYLQFTSDETLMPGQIGEVTTMHGEIHNLLDSTLIVTCEFDTAVRVAAGRYGVHRPGRS